MDAMAQQITGAGTGAGTGTSEGNGAGTGAGTGTIAPSGAPGSLEVVRSFVNTLDIESGDDKIGTREQLGGWLADRGLMDRDVIPTAAEFEQAIRVREALRAMLLANESGSSAPAAEGILNDAAGSGSIVVRFSAGGARLDSTASGVAGALDRIFALVYTATVDGTWRRLKICRNDTCRWAFYDHSKNHSGKWCDMAVCGNRLKARSYRRRQVVGDGPSH